MRHQIYAFVSCRTEVDKCLVIKLLFILLPNVNYVKFILFTFKKSLISCAEKFGDVVNLFDIG